MGERAADDDLRFTTAAGHCGEAADEIQRLYPQVFTVFAVPALTDNLERLPTLDASGRLLATIATAADDFDTTRADLSPRAMLAAGSAASLLALAHHAMSGRLPFGGAREAGESGDAWMIGSKDDRDFLTGRMCCMC